MGFQFGYLTPRQRRFWRLRFDGLTQSEISRKMGVTRQTVNKVINVIDSKVTRALLEAAQLNRIEVSRVDPEKGFLLGRSPSLGVDVLITLSDENGILAWYKGEGRCSECDWIDSCKEKLLIEAKARSIRLPGAVKKIRPSKLADLLFKKIMEE